MPCFGDAYPQRHGFFRRYSLPDITFITDAVSNISHRVYCSLNTLPSPGELFESPARTPPPIRVRTGRSRLPTTRQPRSQSSGIPSGSRPTVVKPTSTQSDEVINTNKSTSLVESPPYEKTQTAEEVASASRKPTQSKPVRSILKGGDVIKKTYESTNEHKTQQNYRVAIEADSFTKTKLEADKIQETNKHRNRLETSRQLREPFQPDTASGKKYRVIVEADSVTKTELEGNDNIRETNTYSRRLPIPQQSRQTSPLDTASGKKYRVIVEADSVTKTKLEGNDNIRETNTYSRRLPIPQQSRQTSPMGTASEKNNRVKVEGGGDKLQIPRQTRQSFTPDTAPEKNKRVTEKSHAYANTKSNTRDNIKYTYQHTHRQEVRQSSVADMKRQAPIKCAEIKVSKDYDQKKSTEGLPRGKTVYDSFPEREYDSPPSPAPRDEGCKFVLHKYDKKDYNRFVGLKHNAILSSALLYSDDESEDRRQPPPEKLQPEIESCCADPPMGRMNSPGDHERKIIIEFCHLLEKSKQLFNELRELPQYGHKQWHAYFGRTFDAYTKLWKFQQRRREILDTKYGLQRWQIGEIASKIGQLYYHFYLRTSESAYLNEAFSFYEAIRNRNYYTQACKEDKCELMVKNLRYYTRFIVVCLLLRKMKLVRELIVELERQIYEYGMTYNQDDQMEWSIVVQEVKAFILIEPVVTVSQPDNCRLLLTHRLGNQTSPQVECSSQLRLTLQEVLIVGSSTTQVKFSELTIDMFRMLQTLEREPTTDVPHLFDDSPQQPFPTPSIADSKAYNLENGPRGDNPRKYLIFKPTPNQILVYLASSFNDLPPNGVLLLYISADGHITQPTKHEEYAGYDFGGLITTSKNDICRDYDMEQKTSKYKDPQCIHPGDLYPFTRRPMFVIVDSDNSYAFHDIPRLFGQPLVVLMSPVELPLSLRSEQRQQGNLFTLFLHSPLTAFSYICNVHSMTLTQWDRSQAYIETFLVEAAQMFMRCGVDSNYIPFMTDDFLRLLVLRYVFCEVTMRLHREFHVRAQFSSASPPMPEELLRHPALTHIILDLASYLKVRDFFRKPSASGRSHSRE